MELFSYYRTGLSSDNKCLFSIIQLAVESAFLPVQIRLFLFSSNSFADEFCAIYFPISKQRKKAHAFSPLALDPIYQSTISLTRCRRGQFFSKFVSFTVRCG
jgi:hypothetical protein